MNFQRAIKVCIVEKPFNWKDRASRSEFWWFYLFTILLNIPLSILTYLSTIGEILNLIASIAISWLIWMVTIRRLHDTNKSGWYSVIPFATLLAMVLLALIFSDAFETEAAAVGLVAVLIVGWIAVLIYMIVLLVQPGTVGSNRFGPDPLMENYQDYNYNNGGQFNANGPAFNPNGQGFGPNGPGFNPNGPFNGYGQNGPFNGPGPQGGHGGSGFNPNGFNPNGQGYDPNSPFNGQGGPGGTGFNQNGFNPNAQGYDPNGPFNGQSYDPNGPFNGPGPQGGPGGSGFNPNGFNPNGQGYDPNGPFNGQGGPGFNPNGFNPNGFNPNGQGYDPNGQGFDPHSPYNGEPNRSEHDNFASNDPRNDQDVYRGDQNNADANFNDPSNGSNNSNDSHHRF